MKHIPISAGYTATVDDDDYETLAAFTWTAQLCRNRNRDVSIVYAWRWGVSTAADGPKKKIYMHHQILGVKTRTDHHDHDGLNNRKANLRSSTRSNNLGNSRIRIDNTSGYKGVTWYRDYGKWMAQITSHGKRRCLGYFDRIEDAALAYNRAASELFGEFAYTGNRKTIMENQA